jgi:putative glutamine amidotransferase
MARPLIAVSAAVEVLPTAFGEVDCTRLTTAYTDALYAAGGRPVILPVVARPPAELLDGFAGLVLSGGGDIDPAMYGQAPDPTVYGIRRDRDEFEAALYREAIDRQIPILAICRGMQLVNILRGGTLHQQISEDARHWQTRPPEEPNHEIVVTPHSRLARILHGHAEGEVNSYHHQCIGRIGTGLRITARTGNVIEAVEADDADLIAVQWHPEQMVPADAVQRALFESFVARAVLAGRDKNYQEMSA